MEMPFPLIVSNTFLRNSRIQCPHQPLGKLLQILTTTPNRYPSLPVGFGFVFFKILHNVKSPKNKKRKTEVPLKKKKPLFFLLRALRIFETTIYNLFGVF